MNIAIGADHRGYMHKEFIKKNSAAALSNVSWLDIGAFSDERTDYPPFARDMCLRIQKGEVKRGVLICGSGVGMAIAANRFAHIYAAVAWNKKVARLGVEHDNANILVVPADFVSVERALELVVAWANATFRADRYQQRLTMIDQYGGL